MSHLHLEQPGLTRITVEGADEETVLAIAHALTACHNISGPLPSRPIPGEERVHTWMYAHTEPAAPQVPELSTDTCIDQASRPRAAPRVSACTQALVRGKELGSDRLADRHRGSPRRSCRPGAAGTARRAGE
ncbi:DUF6207 family protein [Streptomyces sp. NBC_01304]|uniref:DUF6207 family protein n=1 Tax=Streptomyces sp. NBC_01304 TaxID=2903818 RepID=UPI003FA39671